MAQRRGSPFFGFFIIAVVVVLTIVAMSAVPTGVRDGLAIFVIPAGILYFLYSWYRWRRQQVGNKNELEWLDELTQENATGTHDHSKKLEWLTRTLP
jgi:hypothetical protein